MNLCRCDKGHFYDREKYATCPHCSGGSSVNDGVTSAFTEGIDSITEPAMNGGVQMAPPMNFAFGQPAVAAPTPEPSYEFPVASMSADIPTDVPTGDVTVPLGMDTMPVIDEAPEDDNDKTVGFFGGFDDLFGKPAPAPKAVSPMAPTAPAMPVKNVNKVSTPTVGWVLALSGNHVGTDFRLKTGKNYIGRKESMDVALVEDKSVSRESQAIVIYEPKQHLYIVTQGEASSLVYLNGDVVLTPTKLKAYDVITVGEVNLLFIPLCGPNFNWTTVLEQMRK